jgi:hypothetical protein
MFEKVGWGRGYGEKNFEKQHVKRRQRPLSLKNSPRGQFMVEVQDQRPKSKKENQGLKISG